MKIYKAEGHDIDIRPSSKSRDWINATPGRHAQRCLPLMIANSCGWTLHVATGFRARWTGSNAIAGVRVEPDDPTQPSALSHFGSGILTFHVPALFRTEPNTCLMVAGPFNQPRRHIQPLTGIVETYWVPFTFTMNWQFTEAKRWVRFDRGEPFCQLFPIDLELVERCQPWLHDLDDEPELRQRFDQYAASRRQFNADLKVADSEARSVGWQKDYLRGNVAGQEPDKHWTTFRSKPPKIAK